MVGEGFLGPSFDDHVDGFLEPLAAGVYIHANAVKLLPLVTGADAEIDPSVAEDVQHGDFFSHQDRIVQGKNDHGRPDADVLGAGGNRARKRPDPRQQPVAGKTVFAQPNFVYSKLVGELDLFQGFVQGLTLGEALVIGNDGKHSEFHCTLRGLAAGNQILLYYMNRQDGQDNCILVAGASAPILILIRTEESWS